MNQVQLLGLVLGALVTSHLSAQSADKPQVQPGDRWTFRTTDLQKDEETQSYELRVTDVSGDKLALARTIRSSKTAADVGKQATLRADASTWTFANAGIREGKEVTFLFPLDVGKKWDYEYKWANPYGGDLGTTRMSAKVEGWEDVKTPAGTFKALKVVHDGSWASTYAGEMLSGVQQDTFWYAPEARRWVKREFFRRGAFGKIVDNNRIELMSLELGR